VAWTDWRHATSGSANGDVDLQRLAEDGAARWVAWGKQLAEGPSGSERMPDLAADLDGGIIVAYREPVSDRSGGTWEIVLGRFDLDGNRRWEYPSYSDTPSDILRAGRRSDPVDPRRPLQRRR